MLKTELRKRQVDRPLRRTMLINAALPPLFSIEQGLLDPPKAHRV